MKITAAKDIPSVDQSSIWKGYYEAHFMSGKEIDVKYPILNKKWKYSHEKYSYNNIDYDGYYYSYEKDIDTVIISDPWFREFKSYFAIIDTFYGVNQFMGYHTTVEGNPVLLKMYKK